MLTKVNLRPRKSCLKLVTPRISVSVFELNLDEAKKLLELGVSENDLKKFKKKLSENEIRSTPIFNLDYMKIYIDEVPIYRGNEILKKNYDVALKEHAEYIGEPTDWYSHIDYSDNNLDNYSFSIILDSYYDQSEYMCEIDDEFEPVKMSCSVEEFYLEEGKEYLSCYWRYGKNLFKGVWKVL